MSFVPAGCNDRVTDKPPKEHLTNGICERTDFKLYVNDLPPELNEDGITEIFNQYGNVSGILAPPGSKWAFVSYKSHREALLAIGNLNGKGPLNLSVEFAKSREAKNVAEYSRQNPAEPVILDNGTAARDYRESDEVVERNYVPSRMEAVVPERYRSRNMIPHYGVQDDIMYPVERNHAILNPFENVYAYPDSNILWTRGRLALGPNGRRQVVMGRGFTHYELPAPCPRVEEHLSSLYEKRSNGLYEYGNDMLQYDVGRCEFCGKITKMRCSKCSLFYCSHACQRADWDRHKIDCLSLPPLTGIPNPVQDLPEKAPVSNQNGTEKCIAPQKTPNSRAELPTQPEKVLERNNVAEVVKPKEKIPEQNIVVDVKPKGKSHQLEKVSEHVVEMKPKTKSHQLEEKVPQEIPRRPRNISAPKPKSEYEKMEEEIVFQKPFLSKDKFTKVVVTVPLANCECFVQKVEEAVKFSTLMDNLKPSKLAPKVEPTEGALVAAKYFDIWHRALILSVNPLKVQYVDYGNEEILEDNDIRSLGSLESSPYFCRKIFIQNGKNPKYKSLNDGDILLVKMVSETKDGVIVVVVPEEEDDSLKPSANGQMPAKDSGLQNGAKSISKTESSPKNQEVIFCPTGSVTDNLEVGDVGQIELHAQLGNNTFSVTLIPGRFVAWYEKVLCHLPASFGDTSNLEKYTPMRVGEVILGKRSDDDWIRGEVLSLDSPVKVAALDEGRVCLVERCLQIPADYINICTFSATCNILQKDIKAEPLQIFKFEVTASKQVQGEKHLEVLLTEENTTNLAIKAQLTKWTPPPEQIGLKSLELKSNTEVVLSAFRSQSLLYARSLERDELERFSKLIQEVSREAKNAPKLKEMPVVGEMVIAKYTVDDNYYRAIVSKIDEDKVHVTYADFGNVEITSVDHLLKMSDDLKKWTSGVAKIVLKDVPIDVPMTKDGAEYLSHFVVSEQPLKITFDGIPSEDGVELKTASGESINEKLKQFLIPDWQKKKEEDENICFEYQNMPFTPLGEKGDTLNAIILHPAKDGFEYFMCPMNPESISYVSEVLPGLLQDYVNSNPEVYIPRDFEMCIAPYGGLWYRACCAKRLISTSMVLFVDYGNSEEIDHKDLRMMKKDFMDFPALAAHCKVQNLLPKEYENNVPDVLKQRLSQLLAANAEIDIRIIDFDGDTYTIEMPTIRNILLKEQLI